MVFHLHESICDDLEQIYYQFCAHKADKNISSVPKLDGERFGHLAMKMRSKVECPDVASNLTLSLLHVHILNIYRALSPNGSLSCEWTNDLSVLFCTHTDDKQTEFPQYEYACAYSAQHFLRQSMCRGNT